MTARRLFAVLMLFCAAVAPAAAQDSGAGATANAAPTSPAPARSEAATAAAREMVEMMFVDSGVIPAALEIASAQLLPQFTQEIRNSQLYGRLSRQRRAAVDAYIDTFDDLLSETVHAQMPEVIERTTAGTLAMYTDAELAEIVTFLRTESARMLLTDALKAGLRAAAGGPGETGPQPTPQQIADFDAFERTPVGRRFAESVRQWFDMLGASFQSALADAGPAMSERVQRDFCVVLERDCPAALRRQLGLNRT